MALIPPLINGESYSWGQVVMNVLGVPSIGVTAIEYSDSQDIKDNYGAGNFPVSRGFGKYEAKAKITLLMEEVEALTNASLTGRLQDIPEFDIVVSFIPKSGNVQIHKLRNVRFKSNERSMKTGDTGIEIPLELVISHIDWK